MNDFKRMKLSIYENYDYGLINESEKDYLLEHLDYAIKTENQRSQKISTSTGRMGYCETRKKTVHLEQKRNKLIKSLSITDNKMKRELIKKKIRAIDEEIKRINRELATKYNIRPLSIQDLNYFIKNGAMPHI